MKPDERFLAVTDPHGDQQDEGTVRAQLAFKREFRPTTIIHLGDNWDFRNFRKGASDDEKAASLSDDWEMGTEYFRRIFEGGKRNYFLRGNHDERIYRLAESATGVLRDYANDGIKRLESVVKRANATMLPYDARLGILRVGALKAVHGYFSGKNATARHAAVYGHVLHGHTHTNDACPVETDGDVKEARAIPATCKLDMPYNSHQPNKLRHRNGWAYGEMFSDGTYSLYVATKIGGHFRVATTFNTF